ncbi:MAG: glycosyltransferase [Chloroflexi bacterium]|nr:MAG: glycosyltransferase [Chloroflexota bacterium]
MMKTKRVAVHIMMMLAMVFIPVMGVAVASDSFDEEEIPVFLELIAQGDAHTEIFSEPDANSEIIGILGADDVVLALEPTEVLFPKLIDTTAWLRIRTAEQLDGYVASGQFQVAPMPEWAIEAARESAASASSEEFVNNLVDGSSVLTTIDPLDENELVDTDPELIAPPPAAPLVVQSMMDVSRINMRAEPNITGAVVDSVAPGEYVIVVEDFDAAREKIADAEGWLLVRNENDVEAYVAARFFDETDDMPEWATTGGNLPNYDQLIPQDATISTDIAPLSDLVFTEGVATTETEETGDVAGTSLDLSQELTSSLIPIRIFVDESVEITEAKLMLNGETLRRFDSPPFEYDLDTSLLSPGLYRLEFAITHAGDITTTTVSEYEFEVQLTNQLLDSEAPVVETAPANSNNFVVFASSHIAQLNGEAQAFDLQFSPEDGLSPLSSAVNTATIGGTKSLGEILSRTYDLLPPQVQEFLAKPRPVFSAIVIVILTLILLPQGIFTIYWLTYTWNNPEVRDAYRSPKEFAQPQYSFTALLPARREKDVIKDTIKAVNRINYPDHLKEILILIRDEDDDETIAKAKEAMAELNNERIRLVTFTDGPKNKPNGLNRGLRVASNDVVCIFDAEDEPHEDIYNVVNTVMQKENADVVQSGVQLMNFRSTWFSSFNVLEYFFWFKSGLHAFTREFKVTPLGGNTVFFKRELLQQIDGWDEQCLTEDADVGIRLTILGAKIQIVYDEKHATQEETPANVEQFIKQRTRWSQGFYQIFFKGDWLSLPTLTQKVAAVYILLNSLLQAATLLFIPLGLYISLTQTLPVPLALFSYLPIYILVIQLVINLIGIKEFTEAYEEKLPFLFRMKMALYYYPYQLLLAIAAMRAVYRFVIREQAWEKTSHANLHRQSQPTTSAVSSIPEGV